MQVCPRSFSQLLYLEHLINPLPGSGCIAALEAERFLSEADNVEEENLKDISVEKSAIQPAAQETGVKTDKDTSAAVPEYKSNPLL